METSGRGKLNATIKIPPNLPTTTTTSKELQTPNPIRHACIGCVFVFVLGSITKQNWPTTMDQKTAPPQHQRQRQGEVCVSGSSVVHAWRGMMNWLGFMLQLFVQILRGTPSMAQMFVSYVLSFGYLPLLSFSAPDSHSFKPLPVVEIPLQDMTQVHPSSNFHADVTCAAASDSEPVEKLTVVLDLDETLVCAYESSTLPGIIQTRAIEAGLKWFEMECVSPDKDSEGNPKINYVTVFERPGLQEFLKQIHEFSDLVLFTAGVEGYARPLVDRIDTENRFGFRLYRPSTVRTEHREHVKDLSCLSKDLCRIVIVDNNPFSFLLQPLNGIPCVPFSAGQPYDDHLLDVLLPLLKHLSMQKDVRPTLYERFHMPEWFRRHGIPASSLPA